MLFTNFLRRNLAAARLAVLSRLEYRVDFLVDAVFQPLITVSIEVTLWYAILKGMGQTQLGGFGREYYLAYALWANFVGRVTSNWMYEYLMVDDIDSGRVNSILVRPISFYEFYASQFLGYKFLVVAISFLLPLVVSLVMGLPVHVDRLPMMLLLVGLYLVFTHTISFCVASLAFFINRAHAFTGLKNLAIWTLSGELIPLDLYPDPFRTWLLNSPFASGVYLPVGYVTGRVAIEQIFGGIFVVGLSTLFAGLLGMSLWRVGVQRYTGTGA